MSTVWKFFKNESINFAVCSLCSKRLRCKDSNTTGMWRHLKSIHFEEFIQLKTSKDPKEETKYFKEENDVENEVMFNTDKDIHVEKEQFRIIHSYFHNKVHQSITSPKDYLTSLFRLQISTQKENLAQSQFNYKCPDCNFKLQKMHFIPIVYLIIDHFLDCKEHLVMEHIRRIFFEESQKFKYALGTNFNHFYKLPNEAELTFYLKSPDSFNRCSLKVPEDKMDELEDDLSSLEDEEEINAIVRLFF
ncbi:hypothetical protein Mgra_00008647 [Meloidogyne graminicola]|uniref:BED-type domain-containing protein n=1 Tax=Meloidogyne graminicola TaxID=189291 RepID=A0A8S9ZF87_9BILA|nr:hypothetical protein Mgra_00008647 [Meloidogyne graminicola]